jgi:hypothetical protein
MCWHAEETDVVIILLRAVEHENILNSAERYVIFTISAIIVMLCDTFITDRGENTGLTER